MRRFKSLFPSFFSHKVSTFSQIRVFLILNQKQMKLEWLFRRLTLSSLIPFSLAVMSYFICTILGWVEPFQTAFWKLGLAVGCRALSLSLCQMGCPGCLALAIGLAVRALFGAETPTLGVLPAGADSVNAPETSTSSGWSGSWIEKWLNPGDTSSAPGDGQQPQGEVDQPAANVMGAEAPDPMWLKNHISRSFFLIKGRKPRSDTLSYKVTNL